MSTSNTTESSENNTNTQPIGAAAPAPATVGAGAGAANDLISAANNLLAPPSSITPTGDYGSGTGNENAFTNPLYISVVLVIIIIAVAVVGYLGIGNGDTTSTSSTSAPPDTGGYGTSVFSKVIIGAVIIMLVLYIVQYMLLHYFGIDIMTSFSGLFAAKPEFDLVINQTVPDPTPIPEPLPIPAATPTDANEVFNVTDNLYTYDDAKLLCKAYDATLATYDQVESSYDKGGEWCSYGWSDNQLALFPTQKSTYAKLQKTPGHENDCGRAGVNGGYIANKNVRFGVNCYGKKPAITTAEQENMDNVTPYPKTKQDIAIDEKVQKWKDNLDTIMVSPFNSSEWNAA